MARVVLKLRKRSTAEIIEFARGIVADAAINADFVYPRTSLYTITAVATLLEQSMLEAINQDQEKRAMVRQQRAELERVIIELANYINRELKKNNLLEVPSIFK